MKFNEFDEMMRTYESSIDQVIAPDVFVVARIDGRGFTRLTHKDGNFDAPFDKRFSDYMVETVKELMNIGFKVVYGYTESDEISLLFHIDEASFGRKVRKFNSLLAGTASAKFSLLLGKMAVFDCRIIPLPSLSVVKDYFLWRQEDAHRNSLNSHCYWLQRKQGVSPVEADKMIKGQSMEFKQQFLFQNGVNYNELPLWQRRGVGIYLKEVETEGYNPVKQEKVIVVRRRLYVDYDIPAGPEYADMIESLVAGSMNNE
ncbi:MAG: hypothetical protein MJZ28_09810 [Paludibacteraceae bacterium]|nr:hypothetical protein [Paludibacteraceae bacterium]